MANKARQIVFTEKGEEALDELKQLTGLNNSQAVAAALKIAKIVLDAQNQGADLVIQDKDSKEKMSLKVVA